MAYLFMATPCVCIEFYSLSTEKWENDGGVQWPLFTHHEIKLNKKGQCLFLPSSSQVRAWIKKSLEDNDLFRKQRLQKIVLAHDLSHPPADVWQLLILPAPKYPQENLEQSEPGWWCPFPGLEGTKDRFSQCLRFTLVFGENLVGVAWVHTSRIRSYGVFWELKMSLGTRGGSSCCHHSRLTKQNNKISLSGRPGNEPKGRQYFPPTLHYLSQEAVQSDVSFESQPEAARRSVRIQAGKDDHKLNDIPVPHHLMQNVTEKDLYSDAGTAGEMCESEHSRCQILQWELGGESLRIIVVKISYLFIFLVPDWIKKVFLNWIYSNGMH